jgi:hypothetical protein
MRRQFFAALIVGHDLRISRRPSKDMKVYHRPPPRRAFRGAYRRGAVSAINCQSASFQNETLPGPPDAVIAAGITGKA